MVGLIVLLIGKNKEGDHMNTYLMNNIFIKLCRLYIMHLTLDAIEKSSSTFLSILLQLSHSFLSVPLLNYFCSMSIAQH